MEALDKYKEDIKPPTDLYNLPFLHLDLQREIALGLPFNEVISLCASSKRLNKICNDIYFWRTYITRNIPEKIDIPPKADILWYQKRIKEYEKTKDYIELIQIDDLINQNKIEVEYIKKFDNNWDIFERAKNIVKLYCQNGTLNSLTSLPYYPNLRELYCSRNKLTSLPYYPKLEIFNCGRNKLTSLGYYPKLKILNCFKNKLISIAEYPELEKLDCADNKLTYVPYYPKLRRLDCNNNKLTYLHYYPDLRELFCSNNKLTSLFSYPKLEQLFCANNELTSLPVYPNLDALYCDDNPLPGFTLEYWRKVWKLK